MKLTNTTDWPDHFLRRLVSYCCGQIGLPVRWMKSATFRNTKGRRTYSGLGGGRSIRATVTTRETAFPLPPDSRPGMDNESFADRLEALVAITAHELEHCRQSREGRMTTLANRRGLERNTRAVEVRVLRAFRADRDRLVAEWMAPPVRVAKPKPSRAEANEARARKALADWQKKLKLAQTNVRKYRAKVRRYDRIAATRAADHLTDN